MFQLFVIYCALFSQISILSWFFLLLLFIHIIKVTWLDRKALVVWFVKVTP